MINLIPTSTITPLFFPLTFPYLLPSTQSPHFPSLTLPKHLPLDRPLHSLPYSTPHLLSHLTLPSHSFPFTLSLSPYFTFLSPTFSPPSYFTSLPPSPYFSPSPTHWTWGIISTFIRSFARRIYLTSVQDLPPDFPIF